MQDATLETILRHTYTKSDFHRAVDIASEYIERKIYGAGSSQNRGLSAEECAEYARGNGSADVARHIVAWGDTVLNDLAQGNLYDNVQNLKKKVEALPEFVLYVPIIPDDENMFMIGVWCRDNLGKQVMLKMIVDTDTIGGCAFVWKGAYYNFSMRYFMRKKSREVLELMQSYEAK